MESIVLFITVVSAYGMFIKVRDKRTEWWMNWAPMTLGACLITWVAYFVA